jgi:multidrug transporter EmrE-like cation transporter
MSPLLLALIVFIVSLNAVSQVLLRKAMIVVNAGRAPHSLLQLALQLITNSYLLGGVFLYGISLVAWLVVLSKAEVSLAYPFQSLGYILIAIMSFYFLGENVTLLRSFGIMLICLGLLFIAQSA